MTPKPLGNDNQHKNSGHHDRKNTLPEKTWVYAVWKMDLELPDPAPEEADSPVEYDSEQEESYNEGYYVAMIHRSNLGPLLQLCRRRPPVAGLHQTAETRMGAPEQREAGSPKSPSPRANHPRALWPKAKTS